MRTMWLLLWRPFAAIAHHRELLRRLARHEFVARYRGSLLGWLWPVLIPVALVGVYSFVFQTVLAARWPGQATGDAADFSLKLLAGLVVFNLVAECLGRAPRLLLENPSYVKKLVFPLEILPALALTGALVTAAISGTVLVLFCLVLAPPPAIMALLALPLLVVPLGLSCLGLSYLLAGLGVFLRDTAQAIGPLLMALMFLSPVFYPLTQVPEPYRHWLAPNPLAATIGWVRGVLFEGTLPAGGAFIAQLLAGWLVFSLGFAVFAKLRRGFADVL